MHYSKYFSKNKKSTMTIFAAGLLAAVSVVGTVAADGPVFNIFPIAYDGSLNTDYPLIDARNVTKNEGWSVSQSDHDAGINADPGEVVEFLVYYHNGAPDDPANIARNTIIRASLPSSAGNQFTVGATISADNAATVSSSSRGGDMVVRVSGSLTQTLTLVSGSTVWLPNRGTSQQVMPNTINTSGVNIGSINGCWQFAGFVKFRAQISNQQPTSSLSVVKDVREVGATVWTDTINADPGDQVEFRVIATNTGGATINHVFVSDILPTRLTYIVGSLTVSQPPLSGDLFTFSGLDTGMVHSGGSATLTFRAQVASATQFPFGTTNLVNTASAWGVSPTVATVSDTATVVVTVNPPPQPCTISVRATFNGAPWSGALNYSISGPTPISDSVVPKDFTNVTAGTYSAHYISGGPSGATFNGVTPASGNCPAGGSLTFTYQFSQVLVSDLSIDKQGRNITTGTSFADATNAQPGQTIEFKLDVRNTGNTTLNSAIARDVLPQKMTYVSGSLNVDGTSVSCESCFFTTSGISLGSLVANQLKVVTFRVSLDGANSFPVGNTNLVNTGYASGSGVAEKSDSATVVVNKQAPVKENGSPATRPN